MSLTLGIPARARRHLEPVGSMYTMGLRAAGYVVYDIAKLRFVWREFIDRAWFLANASTLPVILVSGPLGMAIVLQVGGLAQQIGAGSYVGAADALGVLREAAPIVTALLLAGVGGSAVCAELGARTIREELDALEVMGIDPVRRLVAPLVLAGLLVSLVLNAIVIFVSVSAGFYFDLAVLHDSPGSFVSSFTLFATIPDFWTSEFKAAVFGITAMIIAAYNGMNARQGPTSVGEAVNRSVVISGIVLFGENLVITELFFAFFPERVF